MSFTKLKRCLQSPPILTYPEPSKPYFFLTDVSTLCQYTSESDSLDDLKPNIFISHNFSDTQCNCVLFREAFTIYMSVKRLSFYSQDTECTILCNHRPLEKFLKGKTENNNVNWSIKLSLHKLDIQNIKGAKMS